jgi:tetratricopeptide (TPR) repeat protein
LRCGRFLRLRPEFALACNNLANARRARDDTAEAVALFRRALQFDPRLAKAHSNLGRLLLDQG